MKKKQRFWLLALALSLLLTCAACGKQKAPAADTIPNTKQEQTADIKKDGAAKTDDKKSEVKAKDKTEDKTEDDKKSEEQQKAEEEAKKLEEQKKLEEEQKKQEE